jgi:CRISPR-associated protein Cas4
MINVSDLGRFVYCPRAVYLTSVLGIEYPKTPDMGKGLVGHWARRELSMRQARIIKRMETVLEVDDMLHTELEAIFMDLPFIFAAEWSGEFERFIPAIKAEMSVELDLLRDELSAMVEDMGFDQALAHLTPWKTEYSVKSRKLNLSGRVDKVMKAESIVPVDIKTGKPPKHVWEGDRIQLCAYGMLLEEAFEQKSAFGIIEYARTSESAQVTFNEKTRRQVINTRDELVQVMEGEAVSVCPHGEPKKCEACSLRQRCYLV